MSAIRYKIAKNLKNKIILFFGNNKFGDIIYGKELKEINENNNITVINTLTNPNNYWTGDVGYINKELIIKYIKDVKNYIWYICGPPPMNSSLNTILMELDVPNNKIRVEPWEIPGKSG